MMIRTINLFLLIALIVSGSMMSGCTDKGECGFQDDQMEYMIFGKFYGECLGDGCINIYKVEDGRIYMDTTDQYPQGNAPYMGIYVNQSNDAYDSILELVSQIPQGLYDEPGHVIGIPDGGDWGGMYFEIKFKENTTKSNFWLLDLNDNYMPQAYNDFVDRIDEKIALIH